MQIFRPNKEILFISFILFVFYFLSFFYFKPYNKHILDGGDEWGYYAYLPSVFIHHDTEDFKQSLKVQKKYHPGYGGETDNPTGIAEAYMAPNGNAILKYTCGVSILYFPVFIIAHFIALIFGFPADGYSLPYMFLIHLSALIYVAAGFYVLGLALLHFLEKKIVILTLIIIALATNLFYFTALMASMAHPFLFFLYCVLIKKTIDYHSTYSIRDVILIGLLCGLITLIRPTEIICAFIPLFYNIYSQESLLLKINIIKKNLYHIILVIFAFLIPFIPQLFYWKYLAGQLIFYSYGDETFDFTDPHLLWGIFSFKNGWLAYTPVMVFSLLGMLLLFRRKNNFYFPTFLFIGAHLYITYSWWCWNYINGFGSRPMVESYAILSLPLGLFIGYIHRKTIYLIAFSIIVSFFVFLNIFSTYQISIGMLLSEDSNWAFQKAIFAKTRLSYLDLVMFDSGEEQPINVIQCDLLTIKNNLSLCSQDSLTQEFCKVDKNAPYSSSVEINLFESNINPGDWVKISTICKNSSFYIDFYRMGSLVSSFERAGEILKWRHVRIDNKLGNTSNSLWEGKADFIDTVYYYVKVPQNIKSGDVLKAYVWNDNNHSIYVSSLSLEKCTTR